LSNARGLSKSAQSATNIATAIASRTEISANGSQLCNRYSTAGKPTAQKSMDPMLGALTATRRRRISVAPIWFGDMPSAIPVPHVRCSESTANYVPDTRTVSLLPRPLWPDFDIMSQPGLFAVHPAA